MGDSKSIEELFSEFLNDARDYRENEKTLEIWVARDDLAELMRNQFDQEGIAASGNMIKTTLFDRLVSVEKDFEFWQISLFRVCAKRAIARLDKANEVHIKSHLQALPTYGMF